MKLKKLDCLEINISGNKTLLLIEKRYKNKKYYNQIETEFYIPKDALNNSFVFTFTKNSFS